MHTSHPLPLAAGCCKCPLRVGERTQIVHGYGDPEPQIVFVGTAPELEGANRTGVPWTGTPAGARLHTLIQALGLRALVPPEHPQPPLHGAYLTYLVRCAAAGDRRPSAGEIASCMTYLWHEISLLRPKIVVPIGELPTRVVCARYTHGLPAAPASLHAQVLAAPPLLIVPSLELSALSRDEALVLARVLTALLEQ